jgi:hypothetical protein
VTISKSGSVGCYEFFGGLIGKRVKMTGSVTVDVIEGCQAVEKTLLG